MLLVYTAPGGSWVLKLLSDKIPEKDCDGSPLRAEPVPPCGRDVTVAVNQVGLAKFEYTTLENFWFYHYFYINCMQKV